LDAMNTTQRCFSGGSGALQNGVNEHPLRRQKWSHHK
jgi:hypothetical protein